MDRHARTPSPVQTRRRSSALSILSVGGASLESKQGNVPAAGSGLKNVVKISEADNETGQAVGGAPSGRSNTDWEMNHMDSDDNLEEDEETGLTKGDRKQRAKRKKRNTLLDNRIVSGSSPKSAEEQIPISAFAKDVIINAILIGMWYTFSISISVFNKWVLSADNLDFHFPLFFTSCHMVIQFGLAGLVLFLFPRFRPQSAISVSPEYSQVAQSQDDDAPASKPQPAMTKWFYVTRIGPCGAATGLDIGLGNMSLNYISLTFYTMCKSSVLGFVLLFAFIFRLEKPSWKLAAVIVTMGVGVVMMVAGEAAFSALGFILIMSASFFSGFRWSLTQILLLRNPATNNPFSSIFFLAPIMFISLLVIAFPVEGAANFATGFQRLREAKGTLTGVAILLFPGLLAFSMTASEFALLKRTSVVTLSVCGIFKEVLTILTAALVFHDELTPINISGLLVTISSIAAYNYMKITKMKRTADQDAQEQMQAETPVFVNGARQKSVTADPDGRLSRDSTSRLIRNSLSPSLEGPDRLRTKALGIESDRERVSPIKRPEDRE